MGHPLELLFFFLCTPFSNRPQTGTLRYRVTGNVPTRMSGTVFLNQAGADVAARNKNGENALAVAEKSGASEEMKTLLRIRGGN